MTRNDTQLSKKMANLLIKEVTLCGHDKNLVAHIVNGTDLEKEFIEELVASLVRRVKTIERDFPQFKPSN
jgi:hypothetical protein